MPEKDGATIENKRKKGAQPVLAVLLVFLLLAALGGAWWVYTNYVFYDGQFLRRDTQMLDLRGQHLADGDLEKVGSALPGATILHDVTIAGITYSSDEKSIVTGDFSAGEVGRFSSFTALETVDATACTDISVILALREALPGVDVRWEVPLGDKNISGDADKVTASGVSAEELAAALHRLPSVTDVTLNGDPLAVDDQLSLTEEFPQITFRWIVDLAGKRVQNRIRSVDFSGREMTSADLAALEKALPLVPALEEIDFTDTGLDNETLVGFTTRHPEIFSVWDTELFGVEFSTGAEEICFDDIPLTIEDAAQIEALVPAMRNLKKVTMLRCGIDNDDMEALNLRYDNVQFVWMVQVYNRGVRTDQTFFHVYKFNQDGSDYYYSNRNNLLADNLRYCHDMVAIDLGHQHLYGDTYFFTQMPHLKYLVLGNCAHDQIPELASLKELVWLELFKTSFYDLTPLLECPNLRHLNVAFIRVRSEEQRQIDVEVLSQMTWLERLWVGGPAMFYDKDIAALREALPDTEIKVMYTYEVTIGGWRSAEEYFNMRDALHMYYMTDRGHTVVYNPYTGERSQYEWTNPFH